MKVIKLLLLVGTALALSACETTPFGDTFDQDQYLGPTTTRHAADPRSYDPDAYMDQLNEKLLKMFSSPYGLP